MNRILATYGFIICLLVNLPLNAQQQSDKTKATDQSFPNISNYYLVYNSVINNNTEIVIYDWEKKVPWQLTNNDFEDRNPIIKNELLVWEGITNGTDSDIYLYDLEEEEMVRFSTSGMNEYSPKIGGRKVAWMCENEDRKSIILYDRKSKTASSIQIQQNGANNMDLNDYYLVYRDFDGNDLEIFLYDFRQNTIRQITDNDYDDVEPVIHGQFISWTGLLKEEPKVFLHEIKLNKTKEIASAATNPKINDRYIVWQQQEGNTSYIAAYDLVSGSKFEIEKDELNHIKPQLAGQYLLWYGIGNTTAKLYVHDLKTGAINTFTVNDYKNTNPVITGDMIVWRALDSDEKEIYLFSLR